MPAPLNTPLDRCNILDIASSHLLPLSLLFPCLCLNPPHTSSPPARICSPHQGYGAAQEEEERCCCDPDMRTCMCAECSKQRCYRVFAVAGFTLSSLSSPLKCFLPPFPLLPSINLFPGDRRTNPATTPRHHLPWGIKG